MEHVGDTTNDISLVPQGAGFVVEALGVYDPDPNGRVVRVDFYNDINKDGVGQDYEYLGSDPFEKGGWRDFFYTTDWSLGEHHIVVNAVDNDGAESYARVATIEVTDSDLPPGALPPTYDTSIDPDFSILPHINGDVEYSSNYYSLNSGSIDYWQIRPQFGGNFNFQTTGATDTVVGIYNRATGEIIDFDEDNGVGTNGELTVALATDTSYILAVGTQNGDSGAYGLKVTGRNQTDAGVALSVSTPIYSTETTSEIEKKYDLDYFKIVAPINADKVDIDLEPLTTSFDGILRLEDSSHNNLGLSFVPGAGEDDWLREISVVGGETYYITVAGMNGTKGEYKLSVDFNPDDAAFPDLISPTPDANTIVPLHNGYLRVGGEIQSGSQVDYYQLPSSWAPSTPEWPYQFRTEGDVDTQIALYRRLSSAHSQLVVQDDDSGVGKNGSIGASLNNGEVYIVAVRSDGGSTGEYSLIVEGTPPPVRKLPIGGSELTGHDTENINNSEHYFIYEVDVPDGATELNLLGAFKNVGVASDRLDMVIRVHDDLGNILHTVDSTGERGSEALENLAIPDTTKLFFTVYAKDATIGTFDFDIDFNPNPIITAGNEFQINETFSGDQENAVVGRRSDGSFVVAWQGDGIGNPSDSDIYFQRFDAAGQKLGGETMANVVDGLLSQSNPQIEILSNGGFVIAWNVSGNVVFRAFDSSGNATSSEIAPGIAGDFALAANDQGKFLVMWGGSGPLYGKIFNNSGTAATSLFVVDNTADFTASVTATNDNQGNFIVAWRSDSDATRKSTNAPSQGIYAVRLDTTGAQIDNNRGSYVDGTVQGIWYNDVNQNGKHDFEESVISGKALFLDSNNNGALDAGEATTETDVNGKYEFTNVNDGIHFVLPTDGSTNGPANLVDNFDRINDTELGNDWAEIQGDLSISNNQLLTGSTASIAKFNGYENSSQTVVFDLDYNTSLGNRVVNSSVYLAYADVDNHIQVTFQDNDSNDGQSGYYRLFFKRGSDKYTTQAWARMRGGTWFTDVAAFTSARVLVNYDTISESVTVGIDRNLDNVFETVVYRGGISSEGLGENVAIGGYNNSIIDNFSVKANGHSSVPENVAPDKTFEVSRGLHATDRPSIGAGPNGEFVVVFENNDAFEFGTNTGRNVYAQRFGSDSLPNAQRSIVNTTVQGNQAYASVAMVSQGKYLVAWQSNETGEFSSVDGRRILAQRFHVDGSTIGPEFEIADYSGTPKRWASASSDNDENIVITWQGNDQNGWGVFGKEVSIQPLLEPELDVTDSESASFDQYIDFGQFELGDSEATQYVTIRNNGNGILEISNLRLLGKNISEFSINSLSDFALDPGEKKRLRLKYEAKSSGPKFAVLAFDHNDDSDLLGGNHQESTQWIGLNADVKGQQTEFWATSGDDIITVHNRANRVDVTINGIIYYVYADSGYKTVKVNAMGGNDKVTIYTGALDDRVVVSSGNVTSRASDTEIKIHSVESVRAFAQKGNDRIYFKDSLENDQFYGKPNLSTFRSDSFIARAERFEKVIATAKQGHDTAKFFGSAGDDRFVGKANSSWMVGSGFFYKADGFDHVTALATKGFDRSTLVGSTSNDTFVGNVSKSYLKGRGYKVVAMNFDKVFANGRSGNDVAKFYDSTGTDRFRARRSHSTFVGKGFFNLARNFELVYANSSSDFDSAYLYGTTRNERYIGRKGYGVLIGQGFRFQVNQFRSVTAIASKGTDVAHLYDTSGFDRFYGRKKTQQL